MDAYVSYFLGDTEEKVEGEGGAGSEGEAGEGEEGEEAAAAAPKAAAAPPKHEFDLSGIKQRIAEKRAMIERRERGDWPELPDENGFGMRYARGPDGTRGFAAGRGRPLATPAPPADAAAAEERAARAAAALAAFDPAAQFEGARPGRVFQLGPHGVGYYLDPLAPARTEEAAPPAAAVPTDAAAGGSALQGGEAANEEDEGFNAFLSCRRPTAASPEPASSQPAAAEPAEATGAAEGAAAAAAAAAAVAAPAAAPAPAPALEPASALKPAACPPSSLELVGVLPSSVLAVLRSHIAKCGSEPLSARAVAAELERRMGMPAGTLAGQHTSIAAATDRASLALAGSVSSRVSSDC